MRSRTMLRRLDRIAPAEAEDQSLPNLSVLSPWEYDRLMDLIDRIAAKSLSPAESQELVALWGKCPVRTDGDRFVPVEIPRGSEKCWQFRDGASQWRPYNFDRLRMTERERYLALCAKYRGESRRMVPLEQWDPDDRVEMRALLDLADCGNKERSSPWGGISRGNPMHQPSVQPSAALPCPDPSRAAVPVPSGKR
jgi:hypothetical protein